MKELSQIDRSSNRPKYQQILEAVLTSIELGTLERGQQLPSISEMAERQRVAKVTVAKAYEELRQRGVVLAQQGKGFYVASTEVRSALNVFLLFDTLNAYKETLYYAIKDSLPPNSQLHLFFHHYDRQLFGSLIQNNLGQYHYYVVLPHFNEDVAELVGLIPKDKLVIIDKAVEGLAGEYGAVFQNFEEDVVAALASGLDLLKKYRQLNLLLSDGPFQFVPQGILDGFKAFGRAHGIACTIKKNFQPDLIRPGEAYLLFADRDLIAFIRQVRKLGLELGRDVGLISYDDTPMKEILEGGITVISTDFEQMGRTAGWLIKGRRREKLANPGRLIRRKSL